MTSASAHNKEMKNLVRSEVFMFAVKDGQFQCINNTAYSIDEPAG